MADALDRDAPAGFCSSVRWCTGRGPDPPTDKHAQRVLPTGPLDNRTGDCGLQHREPDAGPRGAAIELALTFRKSRQFRIDCVLRGLILFRLCRALEIGANSTTAWGSIKVT